MTTNSTYCLVLSLVLLFAAVTIGDDDATGLPLLTLPEMSATGAVDYDRLPRLVGQHVVVRPARMDGERQAESNAATRYEDLQFQLHSYLVRHQNRFWCMWSEGPPVEDEPTQEVRFATSADGTSWSDSNSITGRPAAPYAWIARGFWVRNGELLALAAHFKGKGAFGVNKELELRAYKWNDSAQEWQFQDRVFENAINNFPPQTLASGDWIMTRRDSRFNVSVLIGGRQSLQDWQNFPVVGRAQVRGFSPDEPILWQQHDGILVGLFRDNGGSQKLFRAIPRDDGRTWTLPQPTNFPNATSKLFSLATSRGYRILISNANPSAGRRQLHLSVSKDGRQFSKMYVLDVPSPAAAAKSASWSGKFAKGVASLQYPHAIEEAGNVWVTFSRNKKQTELLRVPLDEIVP